MAIQVIKSRDSDGTDTDYVNPYKMTDADWQQDIKQAAAKAVEEKRLPEYEPVVCVSTGGSGYIARGAIYYSRRFSNNRYVVHGDRAIYCKHKIDGMIYVGTYRADLFAAPNEVAVTMLLDVVRLRLKVAVRPRKYKYRD